MEHFFLGLFATHFEIFKHFGYAVIFLIALFESIPLFGMLIPGQTIIILAGFLVKIHIFGFWYAIIFAAVGATVGDFIGYMLGKKYGKHLTLSEKKFFIKKEQFLKTQKLIEENPVKSIFFGRLHSLTRTLTPFASGASNINLGKFLIIDLLSALVWAFVSVLIGFIFGKSFEKAASFIGSFILVATIITILIILGVNYAKKRNIHIGRADVFIFVSSSISLYIFSIIAQDLRYGQLLELFDRRIYMLRNFIMTPPLDFLMFFVTTLGNPLFLGSLSLIGLLYLGIKQNWKATIFPVSVLISGTIFVEFIKAYFERIRPLGIISVRGASFPSGHATVAIIIATLVTYLYLRKIEDYNRKIVAIGAVYVLAFSIAISRVYLGVHWASDSLAGICLGVFWTTFMIILWKVGRFVVKITKRRHELPLP